MEEEEEARKLGQDKIRAQQRASEVELVSVEAVKVLQEEERKRRAEEDPLGLGRSEKDWQSPEEQVLLRQIKSTNTDTWGAALLGQKYKY